MRHSTRSLLSALLLTFLLISSPALAAGRSVAQTENEPSLAAVLWTFLESLLPQLEPSNNGPSSGGIRIKPGGATTDCDGRCGIDPNG